jgi:SOS-response transcriptional repressor LexA
MGIRRYLGGGIYRDVAVAESPSIPEGGTAMTGREQAVLGFIIRYKMEHDGISPTMREIALRCDISSTSQVARSLAVLEDEGHIRRAEVSSRHIEVVGGRWVAPEETHG